MQLIIMLFTLALSEHNGWRKNSRSRKELTHVSTGQRTRGSHKTESCGCCCLASPRKDSFDSQVELDAYLQEASMAPGEDGLSAPASKRMRTTGGFRPLDMRCAHATLGATTYTP